MISLAELRAAQKRERATTHIDGQPAGKRWREDQVVIEEALALLLPTLTRPHLVMELGTLLAIRTAIPENICRRSLQWLAKADHPNATQDGGSALVYGKSVTLWRWHPEPQRTLAPAPEPQPTTRHATGRIDYGPLPYEELVRLIRDGSDQEYAMAGAELKARRDKAGQAEVPEVDSTDW